jgi:hypothetical protein
MHVTQTMLSAVLKYEVRLSLAKNTNLWTLAHIEKAEDWIYDRDIVPAQTAMQDCNMTIFFIHKSQM